VPLVADVRLEHITKSFGVGSDAVTAVDDVTIDVEHHDFMILLGPSGCGKSTLLRMVAGLEQPTSGDVFIGGQRVNDLEPKQRDVAMVFQSYALYPHKTVQANIEFPLKVRGVSPSERAAKARTVGGSLGLSDYLGRKPGQLSGGQRQRVALARALVREPAVFCMDEPLSNLDAKLRGETRAELVDLHRRVDSTFIYVTHDQVEAMTMGTRIAVMSRGHLQQVGTPQEVYARPQTVFVAEFIGMPPMNVLPAGAIGQQSVRIGVRPEHVTIGQAGGQPGDLEATVRVVEQLGHETLVVCDAGGGRIVVRQGASHPVPLIGDSVQLSMPEQHRHVFDATSGERVDP
jgi:ABC-type sugar transport system ATPase subunit